MLFFTVFFNDPATPEIYTLSLHDALPICAVDSQRRARHRRSRPLLGERRAASGGCDRGSLAALGRRCSSLLGRRSEEHTSELQSQSNLVCRLLLEKKKKNKYEMELVTANA